MKRKATVPGTPPRPSWYCLHVVGRKNPHRPDGLEFCGAPTSGLSDYCPKHEKAHPAPEPSHTGEAA